MNIANKPDFLDFIKYQLRFKKKNFILDKNQKKFVERSTTQKYASLSYVIVLLLIVIVVPVKTWFSELHIVIKVMLLCFAVLFIQLILETFHWLYAKFDLLEEEIDDNKV